MRLNLSLSLFLYTIPLPSIIYSFYLSLSIYLCFYKFLNLYLPDIKYISFFFFFLLYFSILSIMLLSLSFSLSAYRYDFIRGFLVSKIYYIYNLLFTFFLTKSDQKPYFWYAFSFLHNPSFWKYILLNE